MASGRGYSRYIIFFVLLRLVSIVYTAINLLEFYRVSKQEVASLDNTVSKALYNYSPAFRFFAVAHCIICSFTILSLLITFIFVSRSKARSYFILCLVDLVVTATMILASSTAIWELYIDKYGMENMGWSTFCDRVPEFRKFMIVSAALSSAVYVTAFISTITSERRRRKDRRMPITVREKT